ncbi:MAG: DUF6178 family protein [Myxococcota bacterium]
MTKSTPTAPARTAGQPPAPTNRAAQLHEIVRMPASQRAQALLLQPNCSMLVRCMPAQDLLIAYQAAAQPQQRTALIQQMSAGQMQRLWDLDVWAHHRIQPQRLTSWLQELSRAGAASFMSHLRGLDQELQQLLLKSSIDLYDQYQWESMDTDTTLFAYTPDRAFVMVSRDNDEALFSCLRQFVELLYGENAAAATNLLLNVMAITPSALEEQALHWRDARLQDLGFLPIAQWQDVLAYSNPSALAQHIAHRQQPDAAAQPHLMAARLQLRLNKADTHNLLKQAIAQLDQPASQRVARQLLVLTNRVHAAWHKELGNEESLTQTTHDSVACVQMALQYLQQAQQLPASHWLLTTPLQQIFQLGRSLPLHLAKQLQKALLQQNIDCTAAAVQHLEMPYNKTLQGLLRKQPQFFQGLAQHKQTGYAPFTTMQQLALTAQTATEAAFRLSLLWGKQGIALQAALPTSPPPTCSILLATWLAHAMLQDSPGHCTPLTSNQLNALKSLLTAPQSAAWQFTAATQQKAVQYLADSLKNRLPLPGATTFEQATQRVQQYANTVINALAQELGAIADSNVDLRFVQTVWTVATSSSQSDI